MVKGEEEREEGECKEEDSGEEQGAGEYSADGTGETGVGANFVEVADGFHGGCG